MDNIDKIKLQLGLTDTSKDDLLNMLIDEATQDIERHTNYNSENIPDATLNLIIRKLVVIEYRKLGVEGATYYAEGSTVYTYDKESVLKELNNYRKPLLCAIRDSSEDE